eukprot:TRINITY_DN783_c0_g1_i1.p1 TRINITY_DN783_c0_g1~~TRINITY_DN783_c0_g1_i1.p1  ORF type:complete len:154 (+),score=21.93 TRINITY_DN783_c0_g1_i1:53-514(+)
MEETQKNCLFVISKTLTMVVTFLIAAVTLYTLYFSFGTFLAHWNLWQGIYYLFQIFLISLLAFLSCLNWKRFNKAFGFIKSEFGRGLLLLYLAPSLFPLNCPENPYLGSITAIIVTVCAALNILVAFGSGETKISDFTPVYVNGANTQPAVGI